METNTALKDEELEFKDTKVPFLKLAIGGKMPTDPDDPAWLKRYDVGTAFTARRHSQQEYLLCLFVIAERPTMKEYILVAENIGQMRVDPIRFSQQWDLFEVRQTSEETALKQELLEKQNVEGNSDTDGDGSS